MGPAMGSDLVSSRLLNRDLSGFVRSIQGIPKIFDFNFNFHRREVAVYQT